MIAAAVAFKQADEERVERRIFLHSLCFPACTNACSSMTQVCHMQGISEVIAQHWRAPGKLYLRKSLFNTKSGVVVRGRGCTACDGVSANVQIQVRQRLNTFECSTCGMACIIQPHTATHTAASLWSRSVATLSFFLHLRSIRYRMLQCRYMRHKYFSQLQNKTHHSQHP